jgi:hypothetical protein
LTGWYRCRWKIEIFFDVLKNGCKVEALPLSTIGRLELALALFMIIPWRIQILMRSGRICPEMDCEVVFEREEWQAAYIVARKPIPNTPPSLNIVIRIIASFGCFLGRKAMVNQARRHSGLAYSGSWISPPVFAHTAVVKAVCNEVHLARS